MIEDASKLIEYPYDGVIFHKDVCLYRYDLHTGVFNKYPYVFIFHMIDPFTKEKFDNYFAVGITTANRNRREVCSQPNVVFCDSTYGDLLLWTSNLLEADVKNIFKDYVRAMCVSQLSRYFNELNQIKDMYDTVVDKLAHEDPKQGSIEPEELMRTIKSYIFSNQGVVHV